MQKVPKKHDRVKDGDSDDLDKLSTDEKTNVSLR
jgi:hypothetical protein